MLRFLLPFQQIEEATILTIVARSGSASPE